MNWIGREKKKKKKEKEVPAELKTKRAKIILIVMLIMIGFIVLSPHGNPETEAQLHPEEEAMDSCLDSLLRSIGANNCTVTYRGNVSKIYEGEHDPLYDSLSVLDIQTGMINSLSGNLPSKFKKELKVIERKRDSLEALIIEREKETAPSVFHYSRRVKVNTGNQMKLSFFQTLSPDLKHSEIRNLTNFTGGKPNPKDKLEEIKKTIEVAEIKDSVSNGNHL